MKRQVFRLKQLVVVCTSRSKAYVIWQPAIVTESAPKICPSKSSWHQCLLGCKAQPDTRWVRAVLCDSDGTPQTGVTSERLFKNARNIIMDRTKAQPMLEDIAREAARRGAAMTVKVVRAKVTRRIDKAAVRMAKALKRISVVTSDSKLMFKEQSEEAYALAVEVLELLKPSQEEY